MRYQTIGKSTLRASVIGFGCMSLPDKDDVQNTRLLHHAMELGINYFDTADIYDHGRNEMIVGKSLKEKRKDVIIATKVGNQWRADGSGWDWNPRKEYILSSVEQSLQRLQTDYIDLYQLHGGTINDPIDETIEAFELLKQQGKIRCYGISSIRPNVIREYVKRSAIISVMMQYSLLDRRPEESCLDLLQQHTISVLTRGSLAKGLLVNKPPAGYLQHSKEQVTKIAGVINGLQTRDRGNAQTALDFVLQHPAVSVAVAGIRTPEQLEAAVRTIYAPALTEAEMKLLQDAAPAGVYAEHR